MIQWSNLLNILNEDEFEKLLKIGDEKTVNTDERLIEKGTRIESLYNSDKAVLDHILEWELIHRSEQDMNELFKKSKFKIPCTNIYFEKEKINLFAECIKK